MKKKKHRIGVLGSPGLIDKKVFERAERYDVELVEVSDESQAYFVSDQATIEQLKILDQFHYELNHTLGSDYYDSKYVKRPVGEWAPIRTEPKIQRNSPCPCGSGLKYKKCHGK